MPDCDWCGRPPTEMEVTRRESPYGWLWLCEECQEPDPVEQAAAFAEWKRNREAGA